MTPPHPTGARLRLAASFVAEPLEPYLRKWLKEFNFEADLGFAPFNQVLQQLLDPASLLSTNEGGVNVLAVRAVDLGADTPARARSAAREVAAAVGEAVGRCPHQVLVFLCPSAGDQEIERVFGEDIREGLKGVGGATVLDAHKALAIYEVADPHDPEAAAAACVPYREEAFAALGSFIARKVMAFQRKPFKVIAVDCDNTLWTGVCGEVGPRGVVIDEGRAALQRFLLQKRSEGFLLCLVSKNQPDDVDAVFRENPDMVIDRDAFVDGMINWDPKSSNLQRLAERLKLGLDSFLFLDDNPAEIAEVAANAPAVTAVRVPEESKRLAGFARHLWVLDQAGASAEDVKRADFYHHEARRMELRERASSFEQFIEGLELRMDIVPVTEDDLARASQLTRRTNQFNACPQPRDEAALAQLCQGMRAQMVNVRDRFGDYGTVGLMCTREDGGRLWAETFLLSCRALGKGVEQRMLRHLGEMATHLGLSEVAIWFNDTGRNRPVKDFLESVEGRWEDGMRLITAKVAANCPLTPVAARRETGSPQSITTPIADAETVTRIATELCDAAAVVAWAAKPIEPRPDIAERYAAPETEAEEKVAAIWAEVLGLEKVGRKDRFVDLGGSSLQLVRVHARIQRAFDRRFELVRLFENPTVAAQAELACGREKQPSSAPTAGPEREAAEADEALAIVGMAVRLPGASSPEELWKNLKEGVDAITHFPEEELDVPGPENDPSFVRARGLLDPEVYEGLDGGLFGIIPREAEIIDPQQRVFLELCWEAIERAGYVPDDVEAEGGRVGIYAGCYYGTYLPHHILSDPEMHRRHLAEAQVGALQVEFGNDKDHLATRVAFKLNLKGPSLTVQTACSSSLVAVSHAAMALRTGQCDMALAGGVTVTVPQKRGYHHEEGGMLSRDGRCRPFDAESSGTVFSNGAGVVLLKRLKDAVRDGDHIHAVVRGFGMNNDGGVKHSYAAPSVDGQADAIQRAHRDAGVDPRTISYIEAHGTATPLGDPIEVTALTQAFRQATADNGFCAIGSLKSNLGHLDTAAGVCGLIKTALSLEHGELPAVMHFEKPNPRIDFDNSPFFVNDRLRPWTREGDTPRRAGVSSFGVGGTNAHVILEEAPRDVTPAAPEDERVWLLSGRSDEAVAAMADKLATHAEAAAAEDFAPAARTMALGRKAMARRTAVVARDWKTLAEKLRAKDFTPVEAATSEPEMVWMFPGQGAQHPGMTKDLYEAEPGYREDIDYCADLLKPLLGEDLRDTLFAEDGGEAAERLKRTVLAQPAIFVVEWALARQWARWGLKPGLMLGHSVGEFTAACLAGVFSIDDGLRILAARGRLMGELPGGSMLSVRLPAAELEKRLPEGIDLAASNGPALSVVAGETEAVAAFAKQLESEGVNVRELHTSHAFHSHMMDPVVARFREVIEGVKLHPPRMAILSTVTGRPLGEAEATDPGYWASHLRRTVNFHGALEAAAAANENRLYLEVGPGQTLTTLARQTAGRRHAGCVPTCEHAASGAPDRPRMLLSLGEIWARGVAVDWKLAFHDVPARRVPLPTYPFQRKRYWKECRLLEQPLVKAVETTASAVEEVVEEPVETGSLIDRVRQVLEDLSGIPAEEMAESAGFLELGFDSLLLTQAARELQKNFGVAIAFRDLMQSFPTLGKLVAHLEAQGVTVAGGAKKKAAPVKVEVVSPDADDDGVESGVSGPRTRIDRESRGDELTPPQRAHLDALVERYCEKTKTSKAKTQQYRPYHADPRTVNGFNRLWKEMVYQVVATRMKGSRMWDVDGNEYIDMVNGFGPNFLGHSPDYVTEAIQKQLETGLEVGPQCEAAMECSKLFCEVTGNERVCFLNTGSEAVQAAMRIARTVTGRDKILVFDKDYHGNFDPVLVRSVGKGQRRRTLPLAPGIPDNAVQDIIVVPWGKPEALDMIREVADELAAVLVEPVQSRQPEMVPVEFVREVKKISEENGFLLVFDEVITGIRQGPRGAQELYGIEADLATYGKVFGGGALPIGICAGKAEYMDTFDGGQWQFGDDSFPEKEVTFFAGTFVRLPLAMAACRAVLNHVKAQPPEYWEAIGKRADRLATTVDRMFRDEGIDVRMVNFNSQMYLRIGDGAKHGNLIYYHLRSKGVFAMEGLPFYLTAAHTDADVDFVINAFRETIAELSEAGFLGERLPAPAPETAPTTEAQREIFHAVMMGDDANCCYNESDVFHFEGELKVEALEAALGDLIERHPALRSTFSADGAEQVFHPELAAFELVRRDVRALSGATPEESLRELMAAEMAKPFDLVAGPLFRATLVTLDEMRHTLVLVAHHMVCDGWSFGVIHRELAAGYNARRRRHRAVLPKVMSFAEFARMEQANEGSETRKTAEDFWVGEFADGAPVLELPTDRPRPAARSFAGGVARMKLGKERFERLKSASPKLGGTLFATLFSGFSVFLQRLTGQDDLVVGVPAAGQARIGEDHLVGHCLNFLPVRVRLGADRTFREIGSGMRDLVLRAYDHQDCTWGSLLKRIDLPRDPSRAPLVSVMFNLERASEAKAGFDGLETGIEVNPKRFVAVDLFFNLIQFGDDLQVTCEYNTDLHDAETIRHWLECFASLIDGFVADGDVPVARLPVVPDSEKAHLLDRWNDTARELPAAETVHGMVARTAGLLPERVALRHGADAMNYEDLRSEVLKLAGSLQREGVRPGDLVGVHLERGMPMVIALVALLECGAAYVPMDPEFPAERLGIIAEDAGMRVILSSASIFDRLPSCGARVLDYGELMRRPQGFEPVEVDPSSTAYVLFTSGSTGRPKGVRIAHRAFVNYLRSMQREPGMGTDDVLLAVSTLSFDISGYDIFVPLTTGATVVIADRDTTRDGHLLARALDDYGVTYLQATPATYRLLLDGGWTGKRDLKVLIGGEMVPRDLVNRLAPTCAEVWNFYGPTEATIWSTTARLEVGEGNPSIGRPVDNTTVHIVNPEGQLQPVGAVGELLIGGEGLAEGYHARPELTAERFVSSPLVGGARLYRTGDLARWKNDGTLECLGRMDHQVKIRGFRIELGEIETLLEQDPRVAQAVVHVRDERLIACFRGGSGDESMIRELRAGLAAKLPDYMVPAVFVPLQEFPLTPNGKVDRKALPGGEAGVTATREREPVVPRTETERLLLEVWQEVLGREDFGVEDDIFEIGGDSIHIFRISMAASRKGVELTPAELFRKRTIAQLAEQREVAVATTESVGTIRRADRSVYRRSGK